MNAHTHLWLALDLHRLALDEAARGSNERELPLAIVDTQGPRQWVHACTAAAARAGVTPGMALGAALGFCDELQLQPRDPAREAEALAGVAEWAVQFSDWVSLAPPDGVLLEIGGSLQLFGGLARLRAQVAEGLSELGFHARTAVAPTPLGATLLALTGVVDPALDRARLMQLLQRLPLESLEQPAAIHSRLRGLGLRSIGDCLRLPRAGLARRFGAELLDYLDRALGRIPDPRPRHMPPERFARTLWLPAEVQQTEALLFASRRLLLELAGFLRGRGAGVPAFTLRLHHVRRAPTEFTLGLVAPSRDPEHLLALLRERLDHHTLAAPVEGLQLQADRLLPLGQQNAGLFAQPGEQEADWRRWIERLRARLGTESVYALETVPDHRPDRAWRRCPPGTAPVTSPRPPRKRASQSVSTPPPAPRPIWLLPDPRPLPLPLPATAQQQERIETGWWDGAELAGDCLCITLKDGRRVWVFRPAAGGAVRVLGIFA